MKLIFATCILLIVQVTASASVYTQSFGLDPTDTFGTNPYSVTNAFIRHDSFGPQIQYWQPTNPNMWSEVIYRFEVPFAIDTAYTSMAIEAFTTGHPDASFDGGAQSFLAAR